MSILCMVECGALWLMGVLASITGLLLLRREATSLSSRDPSHIQAPPLPPLG
jgi:hypothetical protein